MSDRDVGWVPQQAVLAGGIVTNPLQAFFDSRTSTDRGIWKWRHTQTLVLFKEVALEWYSEAVNCVWFHVAGRDDMMAPGDLVSIWVKP